MAWEILNITFRAYLMRSWLTLFSTAERYFELLKESKVKGYLFEQQNYVPKE